MSQRNQVEYGIASLYEQVARSVYEERGPKAIHPVQWSALRYFQRASSQAGTVSGLAKFLGVTSGPASRAVASLVKRGLIEPRPHPEDRRSMLYRLTATGQQAMTNDPINRLANALQCIDAQDKRTFGAVIIKLAEVLGTQGGGE